MANSKRKKKVKTKNESITQATSLVKSHPLYFIDLLLWAVYLYFSFNSPNTSTSRIHVSAGTLTLIRITVAVPYLLMWLSASYAYIKIKRYALGIRPSAESVGFDKIATGILLLLSSLVLSTILSTLRSYFVNYSALRPVLTIFTNYAYVVPYLLAFIFLFNGTKDIIRQNSNFKIPISSYLLFGIPFVLFAYAWLEIIFTNQTRVIAGTDSPFATYYLKDSLLILTIVIPSLITWAVGIFIVLKLRMYHKKVKGYIYKHALFSLVNGLTAVIFGSIFLQALMALGSHRLIILGLARLLIVIYIFVFIQTIGYVFIARGANKLTRIETV